MATVLPKAFEFLKSFVVVAMIEEFRVCSSRSRDTDPLRRSESDHVPDPVLRRLGPLSGPKVIEVGTRPRLVAALTFAAGAGVYALGVGPLGVTFDATPLWFGVVALAAGLLARQPRLVAIAMPLLGWGAAVLAVRHGPIPRGREAAADLIGVGFGMLAASIWTRRHDLSTSGAACTVASGGLAFFLAFDVDALGRWPIWCVLMVAWAAFEVVAPQPDAAPVRGAS